MVSQSKQEYLARIKDRYRKVGLKSPGSEYLLPARHAGTPAGVSLW